METVFSGVAPSGNLHIGNYIGALRQWLEDQEKYRCFFCVVDLHAITVPQDQEKLRRKTREVSALYIAVGIDAEKASIFIQSHNPDHASLSWILGCFTPIGSLKRMTQFKDKSSKQKDIISAGLFNYPTLMAADILLYQADIVPVGEDQKQHLELTRNVAEKMNKLYGDIFTIPEPKIEKIGARVMSLQNPRAKMSKSHDNPDGSIFLLDPPDEVRRKIKIATTDSQSELGYDPEERPGISNLLIIYSYLTPIEEKSDGHLLDKKTEIQHIIEKYSGKGYKQFKEDLAEIVIQFLRPIQEKYRTLNENHDYLDQILKKGLQRARAVSGKTLEKVSKAVGLGL